jgi:hypothetical protein
LRKWQRKPVSATLRLTPISKINRLYIAAISIEGFKELLAALQEVFEKMKLPPGDCCWKPPGWYMEFALKESRHIQGDVFGDLGKGERISDLVEVVPKDISHGGQGGCHLPGERCFTGGRCRIDIHGIVGADPWLDLALFGRAESHIPFSTV